MGGQAGIRNRERTWCEVIHRCPCIPMYVHIDVVWVLDVGFPPKVSLRRLELLCIVLSTYVVPQVASPGYFNHSSSKLTADGLDRVTNAFPNCLVNKTARYTTKEYTCRCVEIPRHCQRAFPFKEAPSMVFSGLASKTAGAVERPTIVGGSYSDTAWGALAMSWMGPSSSCWVSDLESVCWKYSWSVVGPPCGQMPILRLPSPRA